MYLRIEMNILFNDAVTCQDYVMSIVDERNISMKPSWNDIDKGKPPVLEEKPFSVPFCPPQSHMDWPGPELGSAQ